MEIDFSFRDINDEKELSMLKKFLQSQSLGYPNYFDWVEKCASEINFGYKEAILAISDNKIVGNLVYQKHKQFPEILEIKNLRIHPNLRRRDLAHFMLKQTEFIARKSGKFNTIMGDLRSYHQDVEALLLTSGYKRIACVSLYDKNELDIIMAKSLVDKDKFMF